MKIPFQIDGSQTRRHAGLALVGWLSLAATAWAGPTLAVSKSISGGATTVASGASFTYVVDWANPSTTQNAANAVLTDVLPPQLSYLASDVAFTTDTTYVKSASYNASSGTMTWTFVNPLPAGTSGQLTLTAKFPAGTTTNGTTAVNTVTIAQTGGPSTTSGPATITATASYLQTATKTTSNLGAPDQVTTYSVGVSNPSSTGAMPLLNAIVTDQLPQGSDGGYPPASGVTATASGVYNPGTGQIVWSPGTITVSANFSASVSVVYPSATYPVGTKVTNSVSATGTTPDGVSRLSKAQVINTLVAASAGGSFSKSTSSSAPRINDSITFSLTAKNPGNASISNIVVIDPVPVQVVPTKVTVSVIPGQTTTVYYQEDGSATWTLLGAYTSSKTVTLTTLPVGHYYTSFEWVVGGTLTNNVTLGSLGYSATVSAVDRTGAAVTVGELFTNTATETYLFNGNQTTLTSSVNETVSADYAEPQAVKSIVSGSPATPGATIVYQITTENNSAANLSLTNPVTADLLPVGVSYVAGSWTTSSGATPTSFDNIPNYNNTGRTLLRWHYTTTLSPGSTAKVNFSVTVNTTTAPGTLSNTAYVVGWSNSSVVIYNPATDTNDLNGNGSKTDQIAASSAVSATVSSVVSLISQKLVLGQLDSSYSKYPAFGNSVPGGLCNYQLTVNNNANVALTNIVVIDILPFVGDGGVIDLSARSSAFRPYLAGPVSGPAGVTVYYSTATNPCRTELGVTVPNCQDPKWSTVVPADITTVQSVKFDFAATSLAPGDEITLTWPMRLPTDAPTDGSIAWNSFGVIATRADTKSQLLATEPIKVGITAQPIQPAAYGDFVWNDLNQNGIQDANEPGIDAVRVELYSHTGPQSDPNPSADTYVGFTLTSGGGKYLFSSLPVGDYYAVFFTPPTYLISPALKGTNAAVDSDGTATTVRGLPAVVTPIVHLYAGDTDFTWDQGFYQPATPINSVGDYVWNDVNGNGIQDESSSFGLNGITVNLYQAENPNVPYSTAVTANDVNGNPGYYRFDGLPNGSYFEQFLLPAGDSFTTEGASGGTAATDSNANPATGITATFKLTGGVYDSSWDAGLILPTGPMSIGNLVWVSDNNTGVYTPVNGDVGVNGVKVNLYLDVNDDGVYTPGVDTFQASQVTYTKAGAPGYYEFTSLPASPHDYIVQVDAQNFVAGGPLANLSPSGPTPPPSPAIDNTDNDNNGYAVLGQGVVSAGFRMILGQEPGPAGVNDNGTIDFGFQNRYSVGNRIFADDGAGTGIYNDGLQTGGEPGIAGVTVQLAQNGTALATTTSDASGYYRFDDVPAGSGYTIVVPAANFQSGGVLEGWNVSAPVVTGDLANKGVSTTTATTTGVTTASFSLGIGLEPLGEIDGPHGPTGDALDNLTEDIGFAPTFSLGNQVFNDNGAGNGIANNGIRDGNEPGLAKVIVDLFAADKSGAPTGGVLDIQTTDANGYYRFDGLAPGVYVPVVDVVGSGPALAGLASSTGASADTTLTGDGLDHGLDTPLGAGSVLPGGIVGAPVTLGLTLEPVGEATGPGAGANGPAGDADDNLVDDFGFTTAPATSFSLGHLVFDDNGAGGGIANNGIRDGSEPGLANVLVDLFAADNTGAPTGNPIATQTTDTNGYYRFDGLAPGAYVPVVDVVGSGSALVGLVSSTGASTDTSIGGDLLDHGVDAPLGAGSVLPGGIVGAAITLGPGLQPLGELVGPGAGGNGPTDDANDNLTDDFGFASTSPTAAPLSYFKSASLGGPDVLISWGTLVEVHVIGFQIDRMATNGAWVRVNNAIIPATGADSLPQKYQWLDTSAPPAANLAYRLLEVDDSGVAREVAQTQIATGPAAMFSPDATGLRMTVAGAPGGNAVIETATSPAGPWTSAQTLTLDASGQGSAHFAKDASVPARFYRIVTP